jgi:hypothetical protein
MRILVEEEEVMPFEQIKFEASLANPTLTGQVYKATIGSKMYAVKLVSASRLVLINLTRILVRTL